MRTARHRVSQPTSPCTGPSGAGRSTIAEAHGDFIEIQFATALELLSCAAGTARRSWWVR